MSPSKEDRDKSDHVFLCRTLRIDQEADKEVGERVVNLKSILSEVRVHTEYYFMDQFSKYDSYKQ